MYCPEFTARLSHAFLWFLMSKRDSTNSQVFQKGNSQNKNSLIPKPGFLRKESTCSLWSGPYELIVYRLELVIWSLQTLALTVMLRVYNLCPRTYCLDPKADSSESKAHSLELIAYSLCPWILKLGFLDQAILNFLNFLNTFEFFESPFVIEMHGSVEKTHLVKASKQWLVFLEKHWFYLVKPLFFSE